MDDIHIGTRAYTQIDGVRTAVVVVAHEQRPGKFRGTWCVKRHVRYDPPPGDPGRGHIYVAEGRIIHRTRRQLSPRRD
jgi:hypothetical protein